MKRVLFSSIVVAIFVSAGIWATAQSGDYVWIESSGLESPEILTSAEKSYLGAQVNAAFDIPAAQVDSLMCYLENTASNKWSCVASAEVTLTDEQYFTLRKQGRVRAGAGSVIKSVPDLEIPQEYLGEFSMLADNVFGKSLSDLYEFKYWRNPNIPTEIWGNYHMFVTGTAAEHRASDVAGKVVRQVGIVE